jgi:N-acetylglutamate synthase-like GNAT family acetyltransferase
MHFKQIIGCANFHYKSVVSHEWYKSFGFKKFDKELLKKENLEGCEDVRLHQLNLQR